MTSWSQVIWMTVKAVPLGPSKMLGGWDPVVLRRTTPRVIVRPSVSWGWWRGCSILAMLLEALSTDFCKGWWTSSSLILVGWRPPVRWAWWRGLVIFV